MVQDGKTITRLLERWQAGDAAAFDELVPLVYEELRKVAGRYERRGGTLSPTAVVHETYLNFQRHGGSYADRLHFFAAAATTMRRLLVDYARTRGRRKRGGDAVHVELDEELIPGDSAGSEVLALDEALERLAALDRRKAQIVELHFFGGLIYEEIAETLGLSPATVGRELRFSKAWLRSELAGEGSG